MIWVTQTKTSLVGACLVKLISWDRQCKDKRGSDAGLFVFFPRLTPAPLPLFPPNLPYIPSPCPSPRPPPPISPTPRIRRSFAGRFACTRHFSSGRESKCGGTLGRRRPDVGCAHSPSGTEGPWGSGRLCPQTASASRPARVGAGVGAGYLTSARRRQVPGARAEVGWACAQLLAARATGNPKGAPLTPPPGGLLPGPTPFRWGLNSRRRMEPAAERRPTSQAGLGCGRSPPFVKLGAWVEGEPGEVRGMGPPPPKSPSGHTHQQEIGWGLYGVELAQALQLGPGTLCAPKGVSRAGAQTISSGPCHRSLRCSLPPRDSMGGCLKGRGAFFINVDARGG